ncbi:MAG: radical SAM protein [Methanophagales archaeon]|nr:radical SAM protein [Methanophagales archaeon]
MVKLGRNELLKIKKGIDKIISTGAPKEVESVAILFADLSESTRYRSEKGHEEGYRRGVIHNFIVKERIKKYGGEVLKEIGDEVMAIFRDAKESVLCAVDIMKIFEMYNLSRTEDEKMFTKIGISYGQVSPYQKNDILGRPVDLAARIVGIADKGQILVSSTLKEFVENILKKFPIIFIEDFQVKFKGIGTYSISEVKYNNEKRAPTRDFGYFESHRELRRFYDFEDTLEMAKRKTEILIIGRSLREWASREDLIEKGIKEKGLKFKMLFLDPKTNLSLLEEKEQRKLKDDIPYAINVFNRLRRENKDFFSFKLTPNLILESMEVFSKDNGEEIVLFDVHTGDPDKKVILEIKKGPFKEDLLYTSLHKRALNYIKKGKEYFEEDGIKQKIDEIEELENFKSEQFRENLMENYIYYVPKIYASIVKNQEIPPPLCVEFEITNQCNTRCIMCDRWKWRREKELSHEDIKKILSSLYNFGVKSIIFSGGEPTLRDDFIDILNYAKELNLHIGILSNGSNITEEVAKTICKCADWVRISLDGSTKEIYEEVRLGGNFEEVLNSLELLNKFKTVGSCKIGICYTIVNKNTNDFEGMVKFCQDREYIDFASFKFAHGVNKFLCDREQIQRVRKIIDEKKLYQERRMNLDYLKWFIDYLGSENISSGKPLTSFYNKNAFRFRCFTPYLFSLIDASGGVYPCCHLYYDNNDDSREYGAKREDTKLGDLRENDFNFEKIWRSEKYDKIRSELSHLSLKGKYEQCGDCTRHFFHNYCLTELFNFYSELCPTSQDRFEKYITQNKKDNVVWF